EYLWELGIDPGTKLTAGDIAKLEPSLSMLGKNKEDIQRIKEQLKPAPIVPQSNI
ncbi:MAG: hypothetical protein IT270_06520, partial [Saprospiraceae bacterium]|nr:hypothetical protein [Saprospiraceae bacterium]